MAEVPEVLSELYEEVPKDCYVAGLPFWLRHFPDNTVVPSHSLSLKTASGQCAKWIRVSNFDQFVAACREYWTTISCTSVTDFVLHVFVMPYLPLRDAFCLHRLIEEADQLPQSFHDAVKHIELRESKVTDLDALLPVDLAEEMEDPVEEKYGILEFDECSVSLKFLVVNYSVLWSKAHGYSVHTFLTDPIREFINQLNMCDKILDRDLSADLLVDLDADIQEARKLLIFALYARGSSDADLHNSVLALYPEWHDEVYLHCPRCDPELQSSDDDSPATIERLTAAINNIGYENRDVDLSVEEAQYKLMVAEGLFEHHFNNVESIQEFEDARKEFKDKIGPVFHRLMLAMKRPSLMGVINTTKDRDEMAMEG